jgi:hypothetical protein
MAQIEAAISRRRVDASARSHALCDGQPRDGALTAMHWLEFGALVILVAFVVFTFRQGMKVKPRDPGERPPPNPYVGPSDNW